MGYTVAMFGILLITAAVIITVANYGIAKDSQVTPLKAENIYADRETGKAQTGITILNTCLGYPDRYITATGTNLISGPHILNMIVKNNRSTVLKPNISTVLYNASYTNFTVAGFNATWAFGSLGMGGVYCDDWENGVCEEDDGEIEIEVREGFCYPGHDEDNPYSADVVNVWPPLTSVCMKVFNIFIPTPNSPAPGVPLKLSVLAENGVSTIAPTSPTNFNGTWVNGTNYTLSWNASFDTDGIAYYRIYGIGTNNSNPEHLWEKIGQCDQYQNLTAIIGNRTSVTIKGTDPEVFYVTAVDNLQNEGIQSRSIKCTSSPPRGCTY